MASLVVDAAYVHHGTAAASADNINGWSEAALKRIKPKAFKRRLESALGLSIERACWCAARDGRVDAVATKLDKRLRKAGFTTSYRRIKMDEVVCRNRDCVAAGTCPHLHRSNPVRCRRQAGVDVDVACRALQFITEQLMSETTSWQSSTWTHAQQAAQPWLVLVAGDGDFLSLVETAKRLGAKVAVAAWRRSVHDDLVETADAFLALDDDDVVWNEGDEEEEDDDDASSATPQIASPSPLLVPAQLSISGSPFGAAAPMPPAPDDELSRALAESALREVDPAFADSFTALAVTHGFRGSPHIDKQNIGPFYGLALGDFPAGSGGVCVECDARTVAAVDTREKLAKVDGRFPHWVAPYPEGAERYSLIYYQTMGEPTPITTAVFGADAQLAALDEE